MAGELEGGRAVPKIHRAVVGVANCYLIRGAGTVLVDTGLRAVGRLMGLLRRAGIPPRGINLIVLTHGHVDHAGSAADIRRLTGAPVAVHRLDRAWVETGEVVVPVGVTPWGRALAGTMRPLAPRLRFPPVPVDVVLEDAPLSLAAYGVPGRILFTPGHTAGSVSLLLDTGDAFVGDMAMGGPPFRVRPGLPLLADDVEVLRESWARLLEAGAIRIHPGHGRPFPAAGIREALGAG